MISPEADRMFRLHVGSLLTTIVIFFVILAAATLLGHREVVEYSETTVKEEALVIAGD